MPKPTVDSLIILDNWPYGHKLGLHGMRFALLLEVCGSRFVYAPEVRRTCPQIRLSALTRRIQLEVQVQGAGPSQSHGHGDAWKTCDRHAPTRTVTQVPVTLVLQNSSVSPMAWK